MSSPLCAGISVSGPSGVLAGHTWQPGGDGSPVLASLGSLSPGLEVQPQHGLMGQAGLGPE